MQCIFLYVDTFLTRSKKFHNYDSRNVEGKLCFWLSFPFWYFKRLRIEYLDPAARKEKRAIKEAEKVACGTPRKKPKK